MLGMSSFIFLIFTLLFIELVWSLFFCYLGVLIFGIYIIVDTQMIIAEKRWAITDEDYILGALILYVDIVQLFLYVLKIVAEIQDR